MSIRRPIDPLMAGIQPAARPADCSCPTFDNGEHIADVVARGAWPFCRHATATGRLLAALFGQELPEPESATPENSGHPQGTGDHDGR